MIRIMVILPIVRRRFLSNEIVAHGLDCCSKKKTVHCPFHWAFLKKDLSHTLWILEHFQPPPLPSTIACTQEASSPPQESNTPPQESNTPPPSSSFGVAFAGQFTPWFINIFNAGPPDLGPQHFWPDADVRLHLVSSKGDSSRDVGVQGAAAASSELAALFARGVRLVAAPEAAACGPSAEVDVFGRVTLKLKGVVHRAAPNGTDDGPAGLFQLLLGLMETVPGQDTNLLPEQRSYKIKLLQLELQTSIDLEPLAICSWMLASRKKLVYASYLLFSIMQTAHISITFCKKNNDLCTLYSIKFDQDFMFFRF